MGELVYNFWRYYEPDLGRYITSDPIGLEGGINSFAYVESNPLKYSDHFGLAYPLPERFPPDFSDCQYYTNQCEKTGCNYYCYLAPAACRYVEQIPTYWGVTGDEVKCIRKCLIRRDAEETQDPKNLDCDGCTLDEVIDRYHIDCFTECDVNTCRYPGVNLDFPCTVWDP